MAGMDEVLERLVLDRDFRAALATDPNAALAGYDLTDEDRTTLAAHLDQGAGTSGRVEQRTSKSGLAGMLAGFAEPDLGGVPAGDPEDTDGLTLRQVTEVSGHGTEAPDDVVAPTSEPDQADRVPYLTWKLENVQVTSTQVQGDDMPADDVAAAATSTEEAIQPTYPGVYVEEVAPPPSTSDSSGTAASQHQESDLDFLSRRSEDAQPIDEHGRAKVVLPFDAADEDITVTRGTTSDSD